MKQRTLSRVKDYTGDGALYMYEYSNGIAGSYNGNRKLIWDLVFVCVERVKAVFVSFYYSKNTYTMKIVFTSQSYALTRLLFSRFLFLAPHSITTCEARNCLPRGIYIIIRILQLHL